MIVVMCEFGGEATLGKARELADSIGERVLALMEIESIDPQRLIALGADEVLRADILEPGEWVGIISDLISKEKIRTIIFPSNIVSNVIAGALYSRESELIDNFLEDVDYVDGSIAARVIPGTEIAIQEKLSEDKVNLLSIKTTSFAKPFEDTSRYGKVRDYRGEKAPLSLILEEFPEAPISSSNELIVIAGNDAYSELAKEIAEKYGGRSVIFSATIDTVYGPCLAIEIGTKLRDLPEFKEDLISLNALESPISLISDVAVVNLEIKKIVNALS